MLDLICEIQSNKSYQLKSEESPEYDRLQYKNTKPIKSNYFLWKQILTNFDF